MGYSIAFTPGSAAWGHLIGGTERLWFSGLDYVKDTQKVAVSHIAPNIPESVYAMFQLTFAIITAALVVGSFVERMRFFGHADFHGDVDGGGVCPDCALGLGTQWLAVASGRAGFSGGSVVHINA